MSKKKVLLFGNPKLRERSICVNNHRSKDVLKIKKELGDTLYSLQKIHNKGGGLAAPQIGYLKRIVFVNAKGKSFYLFNPKILKKSKKLFDVWDFCFSNNASFLAKIKRHKKIVVEYSNERGEKQIKEFEDYWSELLQHEIDHLNGILFIDHIKNPKNIMMMEEWNKLCRCKQD